MRGFTYELRFLGSLSRSANIRSLSNNPNTSARFFYWLSLILHTRRMVCVCCPSFSELNSVCKHTVFQEACQEECPQKSQDLSTFIHELWSGPKCPRGEWRVLFRNQAADEGWTAYCRGGAWCLARIGARLQFHPYPMLTECFPFPDRA